MQSIVTKYKGPTDSRGSRIIATADAGRVTHPYDHALSLDGNHDAAREKLCVKLGWTGRWVTGSLPGAWRPGTGSGDRVHVFVGE